MPPRTPRPLQAVEAVPGALAASLNAEAAFFLIADVSGRGFVRLSHVSLGQAPDGSGSVGEAGGVRSDDEERAESLPSTAAPPRRPCGPRRSRLSHLRPRPPSRPTAAAAAADRWMVLAPVTERGSARAAAR